LNINYLRDVCLEVRSRCGTRAFKQGLRWKNAGSRLMQVLDRMALTAVGPKIALVFFFASKLGPKLCPKLRLARGMSAS